MKTPLFCTRPDRSVLLAFLFMAGIVAGSLGTTHAGDNTPVAQPSNSPSTANFALDSLNDGESKVAALAAQARSQIKFDFIPLDERASRTIRGFPCASSPEGTYGVEAHGTARTIFSRNGDPMSAKELARKIRHDNRYANGMTVFLMCCETGKGDNSFAQKLADVLETDVVAPTEKLWPQQNGGYIVAQERMRKVAGRREVGEQRADTTKSGTMKTFHPSMTATLVAASSPDDATQPASSSSAASLVRTQQPPKKPLLRPSARTAALLAGMPGQRDATEYLNSKAK